MNIEGDLTSIIQGIFLLILAMGGNFVAEALGCRTQKLLSSNMVAKHFIIFLILFFTINFSSGLSNSDEPVSPTTNLTIASGIYILFILFTRLSLSFTIIIFTLLAIMYIISIYITYYEQLDKANSKKNNKKDSTQQTPTHAAAIKEYRNIRNMLATLAITLLVIGFLSYYSKQRKAYAVNWSAKKFIFGIRQCASLQ